MKRIFLLLLVLLMLTACGQLPQEDVPESQSQTTLRKEPEPEPVKPVSLLLPEETAEGLTAYGPLWEDYSFLPLEDGLLVFVPADTQTRVLRLQGEDLVCTGELTLEGSTLPEHWTYHSEKGFAHCSHQGKTVSYYSDYLAAVKTAQLPGETVGNAIVSGDLNTVYYTTGKDLMMYDVLQNRSRPLRIGGEGEKTLAGLGGEDTLLMYHQELTDRTEFLVVNTTDGQTVQTVTKDPVWQAGSTYYYVRVQDNHIQFAAYGEKKRELVLGENARITDLMPDSAKVLAVENTTEESETEQAATVELYDLQTGRKTAKISLPGVCLQAAFAADGEKVWLQTGERLYLWDPALTPVRDYKIYTQKVR